MEDLFEEPAKKAFDFASETTKQLITLSTAIIALTITFAKDILLSVPYSGKVLLMVAWGTYVLSLLFGLLTLMALTGELQPNNKGDASKQPASPPEPAKSPSIWASSIRFASILQILMFAVATILIVISGVVSTSNNLNARTESPAETDQVIKNQQRDLLDALARKNIEVLNRVCSDDYLFTDESGEVLNKQQIISSLLSGTRNYDQFAAFDTNVSVDGNMALIEGDTTIKGKNKGAEINDRYHFTSLLRKREERWQAFRLQLSHEPVQKTPATDKNPISKSPKGGRRRTNRGRRVQVIRAR
jgi:ketosteroid isomerase-like protein